MKTKSVMKYLFLTVFAFSCLTLFGQIAPDTSRPDKDEYNFGFENIIFETNYPELWPQNNLKTGYKIQIDSTIKRSGKYSLLIEKSDTSVLSYYDGLKYVLPAKYVGSSIEIKFYLRLENVKNYIDFPFWIEDEAGTTMQFKNLVANKVTGTKGWQQFSLKLKLLEGASKICIFPLLNGAGKLWVDDIRMLIDGKDISQAKIKPGYNSDTQKPVNYGNNVAASGKVKVRDAELYYETYGNGDPLLLLHGNSQSINVFKKQIKEFSKAYKVIAVDTRGQGKSTDYISERLSYNLYAEDMKVVLDSLHISKANILGWSDGGNTGLIIAAKYPGYVNKLAITGACTNPNEAVSASTLEEVSSAIKSLQAKGDEKSRYQVKLFTMLLTEPHITPVDLKSIKAPVLVMAGEKDMILEKHTKFIADNIPKSQLFIFKGASHYVPVEKISEFNNKVLEFLKSN